MAAYTISPSLNIPLKPSPFSQPKQSTNSNQNKNIPAGTAIGSSKDGGVIRSDGKGGTYIDRTTTPEQGAKEWRRHNNYNRQPQSSPDPTIHTPAPVPKSATYVKEVKGVVTSDAKFYPTTNKDFIPKGYEEGYADVRDNKGNVEVVVVPKSQVQNTQATKQGAIVREQLKLNIQKTKEDNVQKRPSNADSDTNSIRNNVSNSTVSEQKANEKSFPQLVIEDVGKIIISPLVSSGRVTRNVFDNLPGIKEGNMIFDELNKPKDQYDKELREAIKKDKPTTNDLVNMGMVPLGVLYPNVALVVGSGFEAVQIYKTIKTPTRENLASSTAGAILIAPGITTKSIDIARTINLKELSNKDVIAPEYFQGQTYPQIRKGETAGELLKEFQPLLEGETKPSGFTASSNPIKELKARGGSSELPGMYQAPRVSPQFLRVNGGSSGSMIIPNLFPTLRPTVFRVTPTKVELLKGVKPEQKTFTSLKDARESFIKNTELGKSYVPFMKSEKEAVIPEGTPLIPSNKRYYFKFEGRRIPIYEYLTESDIKSKPISTQELNSLSRSRRLRSSGTYYGKPPEVSAISKSSYKTNYSIRTNYYGPVFIASKSLSLSSANLNSSIKSPPNKPSKYPLYTPSSYNINSISRSSYSPINIRPYNLNSNSSSLSFLYRLRSTSKKPFLDIYVLPNKKQIKSDAYRTWIKKNNKILYLPGLRTKGFAQMFGEDYATKTLRATFGITKTKGVVSGPDINYKPNSKLFRDYKIKNKQPIKQDNIWIQRLGKRLSSYGERSEIQMARRNR